MSFTSLEAVKAHYPGFDCRPDGRASDAQIQAYIDKQADQWT